MAQINSTPKSVAFNQNPLVFLFTSFTSQSNRLYAVLQVPQLQGGLTVWADVEGSEVDLLPLDSIVYVDYQCIIKSLMLNQPPPIFEDFFGSASGSYNGSENGLSLKYRIKWQELLPTQSPSDVVFNFTNEFYAIDGYLNYEDFAFEKYHANNITPPPYFLEQNPFLNFNPKFDQNYQSFDYDYAHRPQVKRSDVNFDEFLFFWRDKNQTMTFTIKLYKLDILVYTVPNVIFTNITSDSTVNYINVTRLIRAYYLQFNELNKAEVYASYGIYTNKKVLELNFNNLITNPFPILFKNRLGGWQNLLLDSEINIEISNEIEVSNYYQDKDYAFFQGSPPYKVVGYQPTAFKNKINSQRSFLVKANFVGYGSENDYQVAAFLTESTQVLVFDKSGKTHIPVIVQEESQFYKDPPNNVRKRVFKMNYAHFNK